MKMSGIYKLHQLWKPKLLSVIELVELEKHKYVRTKVCTHQDHQFHLNEPSLNRLKVQLNAVSFSYIFALLSRLVIYGLCLALKATNNTSKQQSKESRRGQQLWPWGFECRLMRFCSISQIQFFLYVSKLMRNSNFGISPAAGAIAVTMALRLISAAIVYKNTIHT